MIRVSALRFVLPVVAIAAPLLIAYLVLSRPDVDPGAGDPVEVHSYRPRKPIHTSGYTTVAARLHWRPDASLNEIAAAWQGVGERNVRVLDDVASAPDVAAAVVPMLMKAVMYNYSGEPVRAAVTLDELRKLIGANGSLSSEWLYTVIYYQGVTALRLGENENCIRCRGEGACVLPIAPTAVHTAPAGSARAIHHFTEYLTRFPDDVEVRWLLNLAHMTLGEYPGGVPEKYRVRLDSFISSEFDVGTFENVSNRVGLGDRLNWAGGAIMDDFDGDGRLDIVVSSSDPTQPMAFYRNKGDGTFEDRTAAAGLSDQLGGLYCVQADFDNDGRPDVFVARGGWLTVPMRPSLLKNNGDGTFTDVTATAGMLEAVNAGCAAWFDYDGDGRLDLFVGCESGPNRLYHNRGDGTFEQVAEKAGVAGFGGVCKGCAWTDSDGDGRPDLFVTHFGGGSRLYRNRGDGTFEDRTAAAGIGGPAQGFSCWAWDYDNDGLEDLFATSYDRTLGDVVSGLTGGAHARGPNALYRNLGGGKYADVTKGGGLDKVFATMGSNFADFDNDGYLDFYLGTGDPELSMLIPNRMFKNVGGKRFAEVTGSSRTGLLQKGHGVACGDWNRDGAVDVFVESGGTIPGDRFHNALFQNPGPRGHWLNLKLVGTKSNRSAIGARVKVVTGGPNPQTLYRTVTSGSSFGANPLEVHVGLGTADRVATIEVRWPSGTTQVFRDVAAGRHLELTEGASEPRGRDLQPISPPK